MRKKNEKNKKIFYSIIKSNHLIQMIDQSLSIDSKDENSKAVGY